ncbi:hypothetical protein SAMN04515674_103243 [Pseudarcicella hirudinis]|uniref:DUF6984 domain-containing protein n=1 Tax=Pseudarcicella hirudinis TaxID=1079859 RepID=A0A1I5QK94_9BACT|nr:hypothetical protein [Pseudarcicella hirudinis]SFP46679.1 hypothetical protein SAMN04515674_103243 [Pseudarcicella hirudinis]
MTEKRAIRENEKELILFLLNHLSLKAADYPISEYVEEYEGGIMGSIGLGEPGAVYHSDLIQVEYTDSDNTEVLITLTRDDKNQLLDLDFWKVDFSKLLLYPKPENITFRD